MKRFRLRAGLAAVVASTFFISAAFPALAVDTVTYSADTSLVLSGVPVTLTILSGSAHGDGLIINPTNFVLPASITGNLMIRYSGPAPKSFFDGTADYCNIVGGNNDFTFTSAHVGKTISISATECVVPPSGGGGGGGFTQAYGTLTSPNGGQTLNAGSSFMILWSAGGTGVSGIKLSLSTDNGATYPMVIAASATNASYYYWTVPDISTTQAKIKMEVLGTTFVDTSEAAFTIVGSAPMPTPPVTPTEEPAPATTPPGTTPAPTPGETPTTAEAIAAAETSAPAVGSGGAGVYTPAQATIDTPTINVDKELVPPPPEQPALCESGSLIKGSGTAVYFCGKDGKRYVFVNQKVFLSWYKDFSSVKVVTDAVLAQIRLGGNINYKPGVKMVKIQTDPKVYAVARGGLLRWVSTEAVALKLYGADWNKKIDDVPDSFFFSYKMGPPVTDADAGL